MCGIGGFIARRVNEEAIRDGLDAMCIALRRRGPDGSGRWIEAESSTDFRAALAHTRLSIQDVSAAGAQPMTSPSGDWVVVFNGEIYNFHVLRQQLASRGVSFSGHSDTEVLVAALDAWGFERTLARIDGMFALAAVQLSTRRLFLARDRTGEKPLYYGHSGAHFVFASTLRPLEALPFWAGTPSAEAVALLMRYRYIPAPHSIYERIHKLRPGHFAVIDIDAPEAPVSTRAFWALTPADAGSAACTLEEAVDRFDVLLAEVVAQQLISDRELGAFLSGGIDSSLITAAMCERAPGRIKTFTVAFEEPQFNEAEHARGVAEFLGTDHTEIVLPVASGQALIPELPTIYDEPFADASQLPTLMVAKAARRDVVVALSGDGGDESFAGYERYARCLAQWHDLERTPRLMRRVLGTLARGASQGMLEAIATSWMQRTRRGRGRRARSVFRRLAQEYAADHILGLYHHSLVMNRELTPTRPVDDAWLPAGLSAELSSNLRSMMHFDLGNYLPDDVLVKVDRATMHYGLESRAPLLDRRIVDFAWTLPDAHLVDGNGRGKLLLRRLLARKVPRELTDRPKRGFAVPIREWLRNDMRDWAESLLSRDRLEASGFLDADLLRSRWQQHLDGVWDNSALIWTTLQLQAWLEQRR